jgi:Secretion system C-terminal sorting domain
MKYFLSFIFFALSFTSMYSQGYFSKIIPFEDTNPNSRKIIFIKNKIVIPIRNLVDGISASSLLIIDNNDFSSSIRHVPNYAFTRNSPFLKGENLYAFSDNNFNNEMVSFLKIDSQFNVVNAVDFNTPSMNNGSTSSMFFQDCIYGASEDDFDGGAHREINLKKIDTLGNEVWSKNFNENIELSYAWEIDTTYDKNILISAGAHYYEKNGRFSHITKIDTTGNIIWVYQGTEAFDNGAVPLWIAPLSNQNLVMSYYIRGLDAPDIRLQWIDKDGKYIKRKLIDVPDKDEMYHNQLETGKGDYFFAYGIYRFTDFTSYGIITKYDNDGNIIWEHLYQHELFTAPNDRCSIKDIIELDNGDIVVLGDLSHAGGRNEIWLFKINEQGCFGTEACDDKVILTGIEDTFIDHKIMVYPNPAQDQLTISSVSKASIMGLKLYNIEGTKLIDLEVNTSAHILDISNVEKGLHLLQILTSDGIVLTEKVFIY